MMKEKYDRAIAWVLAIVAGIIVIFNTLVMVYLGAVNIIGIIYLAVFPVFFWYVGHCVLNKGERLSSSHLIAVLIPIVVVVVTMFLI